jgi:hypothetical protein
VPGRANADAASKSDGLVRCASQGEIDHVMAADSLTRWLGNSISTSPAVMKYIEGPRRF